MVLVYTAFGLSRADVSPQRYRADGLVKQQAITEYCCQFHKARNMQMFPWALCSQPFINPFSVRKNVSRDSPRVDLGKYHTNAQATGYEGGNWNEAVHNSVPASSFPFKMVIKPLVP
jgi:hypothetical protein